MNSNLFENKNIVLKALTSEEAKQVDRIVFNQFPNAAFHMEVNASRVYVLARALVSVNGIPVSQLDDVANIMSKHINEKNYTPLDAITEVLGSQDDESINLLYSLYLDLQKEDREEKDKMRNFSLNQKENSSGN